MNVFSLPIKIDHSAAESGNEVVWAMRLKTDASHIVKLLKIFISVSHDPTTGAATTSAWAVEKFNAATYTSGTAITPAKKDEGQTATDVSDARFLDTGLTDPGVAILANYGYIGIPRGPGQAIPFILTNFANLQPGEGLHIAVDSATVIGDGLIGYVEWQEDGFNF